MAKSIRWRKQPPDETGYWLRINVAGRPQVEHAMKVDGVLMVMWGRNEQSKLLNHDHPKLKGWWWKKLSVPANTDSNVVWEM